MQDWIDGGLHTEFEQRLDALLADLAPDWQWQPRELPEPHRSNERLRTYQRHNGKRIHLGHLLAAHPDLAAAHADRVLDAIVCDEDPSFNKQLIHPVLAAIGRRAVQRHLIAVIETGPAHKKVCAVRAWYWSQVSLVYHSVQDLREQRPTQTSQAADDEVADLRGQYRIACLAAFVTCEHPPTRDWLTHGFLLKKEYYPPNLHDLVAQARTIAEADPARYQDLLAKNEDGTNMAQIGSDIP